MRHPGSLGAQGLGGVGGETVGDLVVVVAGVTLDPPPLDVVALAGGDRPEDTPTFLGYLLGVVLVPVAGVLWARTERTRWAGTVLAVAGAVVGVMVWRLLQLWEAAGA